MRVPTAHRICAEPGLERRDQSSVMPFLRDGVLAYPMSMNEQIQPESGKSDGASATVAGLGLVAGLCALVGASCCPTSRTYLE